MNNRKPVIAIDGYSSTGKSSISKEIARKLGIIHMDTGALYRGITVYAIENFMVNHTIDLQQLSEHLTDIHLEFRNVADILYLYLNNKNIDQEIRDPQVSEYVSEVAKEQSVRDFLLVTQREIAENGGVIMDGRDIGTVVLPNADYKFFLTASPETRAERRWKELKAKGIDAVLQDVKENLESRDKADSTRANAPLRMAKDAILIDNTHIDKDETIALILSYIK